MHLTAQDIAAWDKRYRAAFINSLTCRPVKCFSEVHHEIVDAVFAAGIAAVAGSG